MVMAIWFPCRSQLANTSHNPWTVFSLVCGSGKYTLAIYGLVGIYGPIRLSDLQNPRSHLIYIYFVAPNKVSPHKAFDSIMTGWVSWVTMSDWMLFHTQNPPARYITPSKHKLGVIIRQWIMCVPDSWGTSYLSFAQWEAWAVIKES